MKFEIYNSLLDSKYKGPSLKDFRQALFPHPIVNMTRGRCAPIILGLNGLIFIGFFVDRWHVCSGVV